MKKDIKKPQQYRWRIAAYLKGDKSLNRTFPQNERDAAERVMTNCMADPDCLSVILKDQQTGEIVKHWAQGKKIVPIDMEGAKDNLLDRITKRIKHELTTKRVKSRLNTAGCNTNF